MKKITPVIVVAIILISIGSGLVYTVKRISSPREPDVVISSGTVVSGDSFYSILEEEEFTINEIYGVINTLKKYVSTKDFRDGQEYIIEKSTMNVFKKFTYYPTKIDMYKVWLSTYNTFEVIYKEDVLQKDVIGMEGTITSSLYEAMVSHENGSPLLAVEFADVFAWQIDFFTEPREGDTFRLVWEEFTSERGYKKVGRILSAEYKSKSRINKAVYFDEKDDGHGSYYDLKGHSMRKAFLRAPLNYRRISSHFTNKRYHPILKYYRPHHGIDYAAPMGTPIVAVGDGKVVAAKWNGGYGRMVKIRHNSTYETWYGHLRRYGKGIKTGKYVKQGQVIGYVGSSGLSTGPHLDFRIKKNGKFVNYLRLKFPSAKSIAKKKRDAFNTQRDALMLKMDELTQKEVG